MAKIKLNLRISLLSAVFFQSWSNLTPAIIVMIPHWG
jgi:hypothetical protein